MPIIRLRNRNHEIFKNRKIHLYTNKTHKTIDVPNNLILCDLCNHEIQTEQIMLFYTSKRDKQPYGTICQTCKEKYFPKIEIV